MLIGLDGVGYGEGPVDGPAAKIEGSTLWCPFSDNIVDRDGGGVPISSAVYMNIIDIF